MSWWKLNTVLTPQDQNISGYSEWIHSGRVFNKKMPDDSKRIISEDERSEVTGTSFPVDLCPLPH